VSRQARALLFVIAGGAFLALAVYGTLGLPRYGSSRGTYETRRDTQAYLVRRVTNLNAFTNFDYRGIDTVGEEFIIFAAIVGLSLLLREFRGGDVRALPPAAPQRIALDLGEPIRWIAPGFCGVLVTFGYYVLIHGHLTPGGGFQAGAIIASALAVPYFVFGHDAFRRFSSSETAERFEAVGAGGYVAVGLAALAAGGTFLQNILPLGTTGSLWSTGTIFVINLIVGVEVIFAFLVMFDNFVEDREPGKEDRS
jgi:multicomponent Na+:H+ antiporter subunit B